MALASPFLTFSMAIMNVRMVSLGLFSFSDTWAQREKEIKKDSKNIFIIIELY
jgi:hypothetical protein